MDLTIPLSADDRLAILRAGDENRMWRTLDQRRICMGCSTVFNGHEVKIATVEGSYQVHCPTEGCDATPRDWFFHGSGLASQPGGATAPACDAEIDFNDL